MARVREFAVAKGEEERKRWEKVRLREPRARRRADRLVIVA